MKAQKIDERLLQVRMVQAHMEMGRGELMSCRVVGMSKYAYRRWACRFQKDGYEGVIARASDAPSKQKERA